MLTLQQKLAKYGNPGDPDNLTVITLPFPMKLAWNPSQVVTRVQVHKLVAQPLLNVLNDILNHYGLKEIQRLRIDMFGGIYNFRPKRGLERQYAAALKAKQFTRAYEMLSNHSWATAIDLDPERNSLRATSKTASFARPEYKPMIDAFYKHGFKGLGPEKNYDWMHFEIAK